MTAPTPPPPERLRREKVTAEEIATACEALIAEGHKITIAAVRQRVGGGGNQTVMEGVSAWRRARHKSADSSALEHTASEGFRRALAQEIALHCEAGEARLREQVGELEDIGDVLREELAAASTRAEALATSLEEERQARAALEQKAGAAEQRMLARLEDAESRLSELAARLTAQAERLDAARLEAREATLHADAAQKRASQLEDELGRARLEASGHREASAQHSQEAAVLAAKLAGSQELVSVHTERLAAALAEQDRLQTFTEALRQKLTRQRRGRTLWERRARRALDATKRLRRQLHEQAGRTGPTNLDETGTTDPKSPAFQAGAKHELESPRRKGFPAVDASESVSTPPLTPQ